VFAGSFGRDYADRLMKDAEAIPASFITGNGTTMLSNRISHFYDLKGPSVTIDTGCSGSMAALHLGARSIQWGESDISIVGASSTLLNPDFYIALSNLGVLSPEGKCYSWDHRGGGYGRGEGVAILVLKRLSAALQDGDFVHAVIRESAMNQDGKTGTITSPSMEAQQKLIEECYQHAGLDFSKTGYVEAHMTGTATGDPIEAEAIAKTLGKSRSPGDAVYVGSVKTNIGHTEPVSGLASIIKTALVLQNKLIPPNINYEKTNPKIPLKEWNLQVPTSLTPWPQGMPLRASVSNFGYGGTNVHVIMEASPNITPHKVNGIVNGTNGTNGIKSNRALPPSVSSSYVYIVSSKDPAGTLAMNKKLVAYIQNSMSNGHEPLPADLAYTLAERRSRFPWATAVRARSLTKLAAQLEEPHRKATRTMSSPPRIGFVFNGQGAQWYAMGRELISTYPVFGSAIRQGDQILKKDYGAAWSLYGM
jgi:acyl transferase domain-containing protein